MTYAQLFFDISSIVIYNIPLIIFSIIGVLFSKKRNPIIWFVIGLVLMLLSYYGGFYQYYNWRPSSLAPIDNQTSIHNHQGNMLFGEAVFTLIYFIITLKIAIKRYNRNNKKLTQAQNAQPVLSNTSANLREKKTDKANRAQEILQNGGWRCTCGQVNFSYQLNCGACNRSRTENDSAKIIAKPNRNTEETTDKYHDIQAGGDNSVDSYQSNCPMPQLW